MALAVVVDGDCCEACALLTEYDRFECDVTDAEVAAFDEGYEKLARLGRLSIELGEEIAFSRDPCTICFSSTAGSRHAYVGIGDASACLTF